MTKLGRNEKCHCGSGKKYKKCCMEKDDNKEKFIVSGVLRKAFDITNGNDFVSRYIFGLGKMKDAIVPQEKRLEYDQSFSAVFQNLVEAKYAKDFTLELIEGHNKNILEGKDAVIQGHQINVNDPIDNKLNLYFKDFFIRGTMAIDCLMKHTRYMGYNIGFLFSDNEKKFKEGLKNFPIQESDERYVQLKDMIKGTQEAWYREFREMRTQIEHHGFKLPDLKYSLKDGKVVALYPQVFNQTIEEVLNICWINLSNICEEIIAYIIALKLPKHLMVIEIPPDQRDKHTPVRFVVRARAYPNANYSHS